MPAGGYLETVGIGLPEGRPDRRFLDQALVPELAQVPRYLVGADLLHQLLDRRRHHDLVDLNGIELPEAPQDLLLDLRPVVHLPFPPYWNLERLQ